MWIVDGLIQGLLLIFTTRSLGHASEDKSYSPTLAARGVNSYCPYFLNREPSKQEDLKNCTWYKENSCCLNSELEYAFSSLNAIPGASEKCVRYLNYLYCYICAPDQSTFFQRSRLVVCEEFCDKIYYYCKNALLKGIEIQELYISGKEFCEGRRFKTAKKSDKGCFYFDPNSRTANSESATRVTQIILVIFTSLLVQILMTFTN